MKYLLAILLFCGVWIYERASLRIDFQKDMARMSIASDRVRMKQDVMKHFERMDPPQDEAAKEQYWQDRSHAISEWGIALNEQSIAKTDFYWTMTKIQWLTLDWRLDHPALMKVLYHD